MKCMKWLVQKLLIWRYLGKLTRDLVEDKPRQQDLVTSSCQRKRDYLRLSAWYSDTSPHVSPQCARSHWHFGPLSWFQPEMKDNSKQLSRNEENHPTTLYPITTYHTESDHTRIPIEHSTTLLIYKILPLYHTTIAPHQTAQLYTDLPM